MKYITVYVIAINILAFIMMGIDKSKAKKGKWRIREKTLFSLAIVGGTIGGIAGMYVFHHKTHHWYFRYGFPAILIIQILILIWICHKIAT